MFEGSNLSELSGNLTFASLTGTTRAFASTPIREVPAGLAFPVLGSASNMFLDCSSLEKIADDIRFPLVTDANVMFGSCSKLRTIPRNCFPTVTSAWGMFSNCTALESFELDCINWAGITVGPEMFKNCTTLQALPAGATFTALTDGHEMFQGTSRVTLPAGIGSLR